MPTLPFTIWCIIYTKTFIQRYLSACSQGMNDKAAWASNQAYTFASWSHMQHPVKNRCSSLRAFFKNNFSVNPQRRWRNNKYLVRITDSTSSSWVKSELCPETCLGPASSNASFSKAFSSLMWPQFLWVLPVLFVLSRLLWVGACLPTYCTRCYVGRDICGFWWWHAQGMGQCGTPMPLQVATPRQLSTLEWMHQIKMPKHCSSPPLWKDLPVDGAVSSLDKGEHWASCSVLIVWC